MLNKRGFTIVEIVISFAMITIILTSIVGFTVRYRDRVRNETIKSQLNDFKNTITKVVYDDIISGKIVKMEKCLVETNCINMIDSDNHVHVFQQEIIPMTVGNTKKGIYINYDGTRYMLPDSDISQGGDYMCNFDEQFKLTVYNNRIYTLKISFKHKDLNQRYDILINISSGAENNTCSWVTSTTSGKEACSVGTQPSNPISGSSYVSACSYCVYIYDANGRCRDSSGKFVGAVRYKSWERTNLVPASTICGSWVPTNCPSGTTPVHGACQQNGRICYKTVSTYTCS